MYKNLYSFLRMVQKRKIGKAPHNTWNLDVDGLQDHRGLHSYQPRNLKLQWAQVHQNWTAEVSKIWSGVMNLNF